MTSVRRVESEQVRRDQILAASRKVLAEKGYDNTIVSDIAKEAGIAQGTFYLYFPTKKSVIVALGQQLMEVVAPKVARTYSPELTFEEHLRVFIEVIFEAGKENADLCLLMSVGAESANAELKAQMAAQGNPISAHLYRMFHQGVERGEVARLDIEMAIRMLMGLMKAGIQEAYCFSSPGESGRVKDTFMAMMVNAFKRP